MAQRSLGDRISAANRVVPLVTPDIPEFFVIIGAMKSGTTTLYNYLMTHPEIARNRRAKEPQFFSNDSEWEKGFDAYKRQYFPVRRTDKGALDGSTNYAKHPVFRNAPERMLKTGASFRFIYILRHPIDRIESQMAHLAARDGKTYGDPPTLADLENELAVSRYASQLDRYHEVFDEPDILLLSFEAFRRDPLPIVRKACAFFGVDPDISLAEREPDNVRPSSAKARTIGIPADLRPAVLKHLAPDMRRLRDHYDFDIAQWGAEFDAL